MDKLNLSVELFSSILNLQHSGLNVILLWYVAVLSVLADPEWNRLYHGSKGRRPSCGCRNAESKPCADGQYQGIGPAGWPHTRLLSSHKLSVHLKKKKKKKEMFRYLFFFSQLQVYWSRSRVAGALPLCRCEQKWVRLLPDTPLWLSRWAFLTWGCKTARQSC